MRIARNSLIITTLVVTCLAGLALAQVGSRAGQSYDPDTVATIKGAVEKITEIGDPGWSSTHLTLRTNGQTYDVRVGPTAYLSDIGVTFSTGEQIEVTGSKLKVGDVNTVVAREITSNGRTLTLRDVQGFPLWAGGRMGGSGYGGGCAEGHGGCGGCGGCGGHWGGRGGRWGSGHGGCSYRGSGCPGCGYAQP